MLLDERHWELKKAHWALASLFLAVECLMLLVFALGHDFGALLTNGNCAVGVALQLIRLFTIRTIRFGSGSDFLRSYCSFALILRFVFKGRLLWFLRNARIVVS